MEEQMPSMTMDQLESHQCGVIREVEAPDDEMERLMAMGVCAGRSIEVIQSGDPLILKVFGSRIGVSLRLARRVIVEPCARDACMIHPPPEWETKED